LWHNDDDGWPHALRFWFKPLIFCSISATKSSLNPLKNPPFITSHNADYVKLTLKHHPKHHQKTTTKNHPIFTSTLNLIPITSRLAKVSGSRKLKPTVLTANHNQDSKKALRQGGAFLFLGLLERVRQSTPPED
jgi:hypothetical protein